MYKPRFTPNSKPVCKLKCKTFSLLFKCVGKQPKMSQAYRMGDIFPNQNSVKYNVKPMVLKLFYNIASSLRTTEDPMLPKDWPHLETNVRTFISMYWLWWWNTIEIIFILSFTILSQLFFIPAMASSLGIAPLDYRAIIFLLMGCQWG